MDEPCLQDGASMAFDIANFDEDVLVRSRETPVLVDFWAPWCGPCRMLGPVLEKLAAEAGDRWALAKVNTELHPDLSARYGVRGIPDVRLFVDGEVVDGFMGALPEPAIRDWLERAIPSAEDREIREALLAADQEGATPDGLARLEALFESHPGRPDVRFALARASLFIDPVRAASLVDRIQTRGIDPVAVEGVRTVARSLSGVSEPGVRAVVDEALPSLQAGDWSHGLDVLVGGVARSNEAVRDSLRGLVVAIFHLLGHDHPVTTEYRRALSQALYV
jgi:putative thioredoxin